MGKIKYREWDSYDLSKDAPFDKYNLDVEIERQSALMNKWLDLLAQAQAQLSKAKEELNDVEAELFLKAKTEGIEGLGTKPTDAVTRAWVHTQKKYKSKQRAKRKAENNVQYLQNARSVLEHRKTMLKTEADLWICGYFAKPTVKGSVDDDRKTHSKRLKDSLSKRHLRTKKA